MIDIKLIRSNPRLVIENLRKRGDKEKVKWVEEIRELRQAQSQSQKLHEFGDVLFALVNAARWLEIDTEEALRLANQRFYRRFSRMEDISRQRGRVLDELSFDEQNALWEEAKRAIEDAESY